MNSAPYIHVAPSTQRIMWQVILALLPGVILLCVFDGTRWVGQLTTAVLTAVMSEAAILMLRRRRDWLTRVSDGSAILTGLLLAISMPINAPLWLVATGVFFAIVFAKQLYGGLGMNLFNPAMVGYAFLLISFPALMSQQSSEWLGLQTLWQEYDAKTGATILDAARMQRIDSGDVGSLGAWHTPTMFINAAWLIGAAWLALNRYLDWRLTVSVIIAAAVTSTLFWLNDSSAYLAPQAYLFNSAVIFGACFIATDPVTAATTTRGRWIYGALIGTLSVCIASLGNFPDGFAFATLLANACVPLIDPLTQPRYK